MKAHRDISKPARREVFVLTSDEKKAACFVLIAFLLGLATKYYRDAHPVAAPKSMVTARDRVVPKPSPTSRP